MDKFSNRDLKVAYHKRFESPKKFSRLFKPGRVSVVVIASGEIVVKIEEHTFVAPYNTLMIATAPLEIESIAQPLLVSMLSCSMEFAITSAITKFSVNYNDLLFRSAFTPVSLHPDESGHLSTLIRQLKNHAGLKPGLLQREIVLLYFNLILYKASLLSLEYQNDVRLLPRRKEKLFLQYIALVQRCCRKEHSVKFYADSLCITTGYLGKAVREMGGRSAKHFIEMAVVSEAYMLLGDQELSIADIAEELAFSGTSTFSTFFKKIAMTSPSAYRESILQNKV